MQISCKLLIVAMFLFILENRFHFEEKKCKFKFEKVILTNLLLQKVHITTRNKTFWKKHVLVLEIISTLIFRENYKNSPLFDLTQGHSSANLPKVLKLNPAKKFSRLRKHLCEWLRPWAVAWVAQDHSVAEEGIVSFDLFFRSVVNCDVPVGWTNQSSIRPLFIVIRE